MRDAVGGLQHRAGPAPGRRQEVGHGRGRDQRRARRRVGEQGGLGVGVAPHVGVGVGVGAGVVVWAAVGEGEGVAMHGRGDVGLRPAVGIVSVPFLVAGSVMLHLRNREERGLGHSWNGASGVKMEPRFLLGLQEINQFMQESGLSSMLLNRLNSFFFILCVARIAINLTF